MKAFVAKARAALWVAITAVLFAIPTLAQAAQIPGAILFRASDNQLVAREATLDIPTNWQDVTLTFGQDKMTATSYRVAGNIVAFLFRELPYDQGGYMMVLKGRYQGGKMYRGEIFIAAKSSEDSATILNRVVQDREMRGFSHHASFYFGAVRTINGVPVVTGRPVDSNNPCPYGPCWTTGGVGRWLEYYPGGPIQNPGHPYPVAGFMRGVPYAWTRGGQLAAQVVGTLRAAAIYDNINYYRNWGWGFWFFPWAGFY